MNKFIDPNYGNLAAPPAVYGSGAGLQLLGERWNRTGSGVAFAVPVRPCDKDKRGCRDFGGYGDKKLSELEAPEFNDRADFIRELYAKKTFDLADGGNFFLKLGRQQVVWGRTDLFRVLDVINPVDYSPQQHLRRTAGHPHSDVDRPGRMADGWLGQHAGAQPAGGVELRQVPAEQPGPVRQPQRHSRRWLLLPRHGQSLGPRRHGGQLRRLQRAGHPGAGRWRLVRHQLRAEPDRHPQGHLPEWSLANTQLGMKFEGVTQGGLNFSVNALTYRSQLPSLRSINQVAINPFTGAHGNTSPFSDRPRAFRPPT
ncbi:MAG: hypothetical protein IPJ52_04550 [Rhodocyclaceae bacterium]|nr:hypothetical protein [Rhodocyclaceae bacterium]